MRFSRRRVLLAAGALVVAAGLATTSLALDGCAGNNSASQLGLRVVAPTPPRLRAAKPPPFVWPLYGYDKRHTRAFVAGHAPTPPFKRVWSFRGAGLLEFPPVIGRGRIVQLADNGVVNAIAKNTGRVLWRHRLGTLAASAPAVGGVSVYVALLKGKRGGGGRIVSLTLGRGKLRWSRYLASRSESSPLLDRGRLYVGTESGTLLCLDAHTGRTVWTYQAAGAIKASPTLDRGMLFFGDYGGQVQAVSARDGHRVWATGAGGGTFYSTAAVGFGRVYLGNTDGREYAFSEATGHLDWAKATGNYVYSSAALADVPGQGPTLYFGSYDGRFYALNASTGGVRWSYAAGGRISGSPTIVGHVVYFADLGSRSTYGLSTRTGRVLFHMPHGSFDPVVSDGQHLFVTGYNGLFSLRPVRGGRPNA